MAVGTSQQNPEQAARTDGVLKVVSASTTLTPNERVVRVVGGTGLTITLPPVSQCAGMTFSFLVLSITSGTVAVQDQDDSEDHEGDLALTQANDGGVLFSDGRKWWRFNVTET